MAASSSSSPVSGNQLILTEEQWNRLYPRAEYGNTVHGKSHILHYLGALKQPLAVAEGFLNGKDKVLVVSRLKKVDETNYNLTPLMVAVMRGQLELARYLLDKANETGCLKDCLNQKDVYDFTALHHATLSAPSFVTNLLEIGADLEAKTHTGYTYKQLQWLTNPDVPAPSARTTQWEVKGELRYVSELTEQERESLGFDYRDGRLYSGQEALCALWRQEPVKFDGDIYLAGVEKWKKCPPQLQVRSCPEIGKHQMGLFAGELISFGDILGPYGSQWIPNNPPSTIEERTDRYWDGDSHNFTMSRHFDGESVRNGIPMMNVGFPNTQWRQMDLGEGVVDTLVAIDTIKPGEELLGTYGPHHDIVWCEQRLLGKDRMEAFFAKGLSFIVDEIRGLLARKTLNKASQRRLQVFKEGVYYALSAPKALMHLHFKGIVRAKEWLAYLSETLIEKNGRYNPWWDSFQGDANARDTFYVVLKVIDDLQTQMEGMPQEQFKGISEWFLNALDNYHVFELTKAMQDVETSLGQGAFSLDSVSAGLDDYNWLEDAKSPLRTINKGKLFFEYAKLFGFSDSRVRSDILKNLKYNISEDPYSFKEGSQHLLSLVDLGEQYGLSVKEMAMTMSQVSEEGIKALSPLDRR